MHSYSLSHLTDGAVLRELTALVARDCATTASLLAHLAEVDDRRLYAPEGYPSMHAYCVERLRLSEQGALKRISRRPHRPADSGDLRHARRRSAQHERRAPAGALPDP
jgi:hypothetical protein